MNNWRKSMPKIAGRYIIKCDETNYKEAEVVVYYLGDSLWVSDEDVGRHPIRHYHNGLTSIEWKLVESHELNLNCK